jgi:hypothetical protein
MTGRCIKDAGSMVRRSVCGKEITPDSLVPHDLQSTYMNLMRGEIDEICFDCKQHFVHVFSKSNGW